MNDNRKSAMQEALEAVRLASDNDDMSDAEFRDLLDQFRARLAERDGIKLKKWH